MTRALAIIALVACSSPAKHDAAARKLLAQLRGTSVFADYVPSPQNGRDGQFAVRPPSQCEVAILPNGEDSFAARMALLERAQRSIRIQALIFTGDESGLRVAEVLKQKRRAGVSVRVIVDAVNNLAPQTQWMYFDLKRHGVEIEGYEALGLQLVNELPVPLLRPLRDPNHPNKRYHEKLWIVDGVEAVTGGLNIANEYFRIDPANVKRYWRDQDVLVRGAIVRDLVATFDRNWKHFKDVDASRGNLADAAWRASEAILGRTGDPNVTFERRDDLVRTVAAFESRPVAADYHAARCLFLQARPRLEETYIQQTHLKILGSAQREVLIANAYFVPTPSITLAIREAAARCVRVVIIANSPETNDTPGMSLLGRGYYRDLLAANKPACNGRGVEIWEWTGKRAGDAKQTQGLLHAKYVVADEQLSLVGSYNLDPRSERLNSESALVYENATLAAQLAQLFAQDLAWSRRITAEEAASFERPESVRERFKKELAELFEDQL